MKRRQAGLSLVEILVGVAVLGVILAVAAPSLAELMERRRIVAAAGEIADVLNYAKSEANAASGDKITLHAEPVPDGLSSCIRLTTSSNYDYCGCDRSGAALCSGGPTVVLRDFVLPKDTGVSFETTGNWGARPYIASISRNTRYTNITDVQVTVTGRRTGAQLRVQYNDVGRVRTCSPGGSISGFPSCG